MGNLFDRLLHFRCRLMNLSYKFSAGDEDVLVQVKQGVLRGRKFRSVLTYLPYYGFLGIPYAKPPVDELRFQPPQPAESWDGVYNAMYERKPCQQVLGVMWFKKFVWGSEDCLYMNVYTPQNPSKINVPKPVMVFVHGGGFVVGSGSRRGYAPDFLMNGDVIVVTFNYRLHVLGFLNLGIPECPGNAGLKDQVMALRWVKENISSFGGDPNNVTVFGESAGSSSVHYLLLSPLAKGLFHKAIMESGSAASPWGFTYNPIEQAFDIGKRCGYYGNDVRELLVYLQGLAGDKITIACADMMFALRKQFVGRFNNIAPSVEVIKEGAFLPDFPLDLARTATPVPVIFGVNDHEGMLIFMNVMPGNFFSTCGNDFSVVLRNNFKINPLYVPDACSKIKRFYFGNEDVSMDTASDMVDLYSDLTCYYGYEAIDFLINSDTPPYVYEFSYSGSMNFLTRLINLVKRTNIRGAAHGEELFYLFYPEIFLWYPRPEGKDLRMINEMTLMWTNFAKTSNPSGNVEWKPSTPKNPRYLQISDDIKMVDGKYYGRRLEYLKSLLKPVVDPGAKPWDIYDISHLYSLQGVHI